MTQAIVNEIGKITDLLQDITNDTYGLDPEPTLDTVDTLDTAIITCQVILTRFQRVRGWVVEALKEETTKDDRFPEHNVADLIRWDQITKGVEVPF